MFVVKGIDGSRRESASGSILRDTKDVADVVAGITGSAVAGQEAQKFASQMHFGDKISAFTWGQSLECVKD